MRKLIAHLHKLRNRPELADERGATMLEWVLVLGAIAIPGYWTIKLAFATLLGHYQMITTINGLPFP